MEFLSYLISGISLGSIYAIIALGYTMVYGIAKMLNFAHGDIIMIGGYVSFCSMYYLNLPPIVATLLAVIACTVLGIVIERLAYAPLRSAPSLAVLITAIGVSYFLQNSALLIWKAAAKTYPPVVAGAVQLFNGQLTISYISLLTIAACIVIMLALTTFVSKSKMGKAMRACSEDKGAAQLMGINVNSTISATFAIGSALAAIAGGLTAGILFSELVLLLLLRLTNLPVQFGFDISPGAIGQTIVLFGFLFLLTLLSNLVRLGRSKPIELLHSDHTGEKEPRTKWILAALGLVSLLGGYWISLTVKDPISAMLLFFVAVFLVIIGTFCLFTAGSIAVLKRLRANRAFYYQPQHFTAVSGMLYRMKQNAVGLANICILSTMVLVTVSTTVCLYLGLGNTLDNLYPHDIQISQRQKNALTDADPAALLAQTEAAAAEEGRTLRHESYIIHSRVYWTLSGDTFHFENQQEGIEYTVSLMTAAEYNRLTGRAVSLAPDEMLVYTSEGTVPETFRIEATSYRVAGTLDTFQGESRAMISNVPNAGFVVADDSVLSAIYAQSGGNFTTYLDCYLDCDGTDAEKIAFYNVLNNTIGAANDIYMNSRQLSAIDFYSMYGGFLFLGMFLGILFLSATTLIIYYKQVSEGYEDRKRFEIMQQVGMSRREVRQTINSQVRMVFFLPLAVAALHILMAFSMIRKLLLLFSLTDVKLFALCTVGTLLIFSAIYALVYSFTAKTYYKIVRST